MIKNKYNHQPLPLHRWLQTQCLDEWKLGDKVSLDGRTSNRSGQWYTNFQSFPAYSSPTIPAQLFSIEPFLLLGTNGPPRFLPLPYCSLLCRPGLDYMSFSLTWVALMENHHTTGGMSVAFLTGSLYRSGNIYSSGFVSLSLSCRAPTLSTPAYPPARQTSYLSGCASVTYECSIAH